MFDKGLEVAEHRCCGAAHQAFYDHTSGCGAGIMSTPKPRVVRVPSPGSADGVLKALGGSKIDAFNNTITNQVLAALWVQNYDEKTNDEQY